VLKIFTTASLGSRPPESKEDVVNDDMGEAVLVADKLHASSAAVAVAAGAFAVVAAVVVVVALADPLFLEPSQQFVEELAWFDRFPWTVGRRWLV